VDPGGRNAASSTIDVRDVEKYPHNCHLVHRLVLGWTQLPHLRRSDGIFGVLHVAIILGT
jgi:hypothetical protein